MATRGPDLAALGFDPKVLAKKYAEEREKRIDPRGSEQWQLIFPNSPLQHLLEDPHVPKFERPAVQDEIDVALLGGGFGTLLTGSKLRMKGFTKMRVIEEGGGFGGTWYWNRYPNAACDTEAYVYLPLLEETGWMPATKYPKAKEILAYCDMVAQKYNLYDGALFSTHITELKWNDSIARWEIRTDRGDLIKARSVVSSVGNLTRAKLPGITGVESFKGKSFHTSRWDYDYTGGDSDGNLHKLQDKVVGIIGTGATAIQVVPALGKYAKHLYVFQRTPSSVDIRNQQVTDPTWWKEYTKEPGWQKKRMENFHIITSGGIVAKDLVNDGWTSTMQHLLGLKKKYQGSGMKNSELLQLADYSKMNSIRDLVDRVVKDKATAEALKPWYNQYCKRPTFSDEYLQTFNLPNVTLVDTNGKGVDSITQDGIMANGTEYKLDLIVFATGFEYGATSPQTYERRLGFKCIGKNGLTLSEKWKNGSATLHGVNVNGFPNLFFMQSLQTALPFNFHHLLFELSDHVVWMINAMKERNLLAIEPSPEGEQAYVDKIIALAPLRSSFYQQCTPGYYSGDGDLHKRQARNLPYGAGTDAFFGLLKKWRDDGQFAGMTVRSGNEAKL